MIRFDVELMSFLHSSTGLSTFYVLLNLHLNERILLLRQVTDPVAITIFVSEFGIINLWSQYDLGSSTI